MAYKYNERTGEFEDIPMPRKRASGSSTSNGSLPSSVRRITQRPIPSARPFNPPPPPKEHKVGDTLLGLLSGIGVLFLQLLPYLLIGGLVSMCD